MADIDIRVTGRAGRITFDRPKALNALTHDMGLAIDAALRLWRDNDAIDLVVIDARGDKAFCAGGDIAELYETGIRGDFSFGHAFWRAEYRLNAFIEEYPKPIISFMQGYVMGGGVGIGCHTQVRVVDHGTQISMPECGIGLVPDVGGSSLLARAPGHLGEYLGLTGARMDSADAIFTGFADCLIPRENWGDVIQLLESSGDISHIKRHSVAPTTSTFAEQAHDINRLFSHATLDDMVSALLSEPGEIGESTLKSIRRNSPLSMACTAEIIRRVRQSGPNIRSALELEFRFTYRVMKDGDFLEGTRARLIDKDNNPAWQYAGQSVPQAAINHMLAPLDKVGLVFETKE